MKWTFEGKVLRRSVIIAAALIAMLCGGALVMHHLLLNPRVVLLLPDGNAKWIRADGPFDPARFDFDTTTRFKISVSAHSPATLKVAALRRVRVLVDGSLLLDTGPDLSKWKNAYLVELPAATGRQQLGFVVSNQRGPSLLRVNCPAIGLASNARWQASGDDQSWTPAQLADEVPQARLPSQFGSTWRDLIHLSWVWISVFIVGFFICLRWPLRGGVVRWILWVAWFVLAANNMMKVPLVFGYDVDSHYRYIHYVSEHLSLPRPDAGWQYFQSPLYYVLSAGLNRLLMLLGVASGLIPYLLRMIPLGCGAAMIEICFRTSRLLFPTRDDLQAIATMVGGLMPVNIYMSQAVSNEPLAAVSAGWITYIAMRILIQPSEISRKDMLMAGIVLGIAWLTKINTVIWIVPLGAAIAVSLARHQTPAVQWFKSFGIIACAALVLSGGLFVRNLRVVHKLFYLQSSGAGDQWWQSPGYRTPRMFYEFGQVFAHPIYNGLQSVWDSLYGTMWANGIPTGQPPWNYGLMSCGLWLALIPMIAMLIGISCSLTGKIPHLWFATLAVICFVVAVSYVYLTLPIYSCAKASYLLGVVPCFGLLAAAGFDWMSPNRWLRAIAGGGMICWAVTAYLTYFVAM